MEWQAEQEKARSTAAPDPVPRPPPDIAYRSARSDLAMARDRQFESTFLQLRVKRRTPKSAPLRRSLARVDRQDCPDARHFPESCLAPVGKGSPTLGVCPFTPTRTSRPWWSRAARPRFFRDPMTLIRIKAAPKRATISLLRSGTVAIFLRLL